MPPLLLDLRKGDKVKATLGSTVIYGTIMDVSNPHDKDLAKYEIQIEGTAIRMYAWYSSGWEFTRVMTLPTKLFAVVTVPDNAFVRTGRNEWMSLDGDLFQDKSILPSVTAGTATIAFEGVGL